MFFNNRLNTGLLKRVLQIHPITLQIIKIWNSISEASRVLNINISFISQVCDKQCNQAGGYYWRYLNEFINDNYIRCDKDSKIDIFNLLPGIGNLRKYIDPCFIPYPYEKFGKIYNINRYIISNCGRTISIKNFPFIKEIKPLLNKGYQRIDLIDNDLNLNHYSVHRLVAKAFVYNDDPMNKTQINHLDENPLNNHCTNLQWVTPKENINYGTALIRRAMSRGKPVEKYDLNTGITIEEFWSTAEASRITGINKSCIKDAIYRIRQKSAGGYGWRLKIFIN